MAIDLTTITVADFKTQFPRDFPYLPVWDVANQPFNTGDRVYYTPTKLFYDALQNGVTSTPDTLGADWVVVDDNIENYVQDSDIERAFAEAQVNFNQALFSTDAEIQLAYLYLTAHYLVVDLKNANAGLSSSGNFPVASRSVGSVSESYNIPKTYQDNPIFSYLSQTGYGLKYLSLLLPKLIGNVGAVCGATKP